MCEKSQVKRNWPVPSVFCVGITLVSARMRTVEKPTAAVGILALSMYGSSEPVEAVTGAGAGAGAGGGVATGVDLRFSVTKAVSSPVIPLSSPPHAATAKTSKIDECKRALLMSCDPSTQRLEAVIARGTVKILITDE